MFYGEGEVLISLVVYCAFVVYVWLFVYLYHYFFFFVVASAGIYVGLERFVFFGSSVAISVCFLPIYFWVFTAFVWVSGHLITVLM